MSTTQLNEAASGTTASSKRQRLIQRHEALKVERSTWLEHWREIAEHMAPRAFRDQRSDANRGTKKHSKIINFTPLEARRTLASGMMTGITSPARPWFRLAVVGSPDIGNSPGVKAWLSECEKVQRESLARSNIYNGLHLMYADLGPFGVTAMLVESDEEDGARCYVFPIGSYCLAAGPRGNVDTIFREISLTVSQLVELFGLEKLCEATRNQHANGKLDQRVDVVHAIYPNPDFEEGVLGPRGKKWLSDWWETTQGLEGGFLRESGFAAFPVLAPRWTRTGEDVYGSSPGMDALGDCKALQLFERRTAQAVDKIVNPPMVASTAARNTPVSLLPGGVNFIDALGQGQAMRPAVDINFGVITVLTNEKMQCENRIKKAFYAHLWLLITDSVGDMTATEVDERKEEKLQQLGAVLEALNDEALDPLLDLLFDINLAAGRIPPAPPELEGRELKPEYISIMAAAQKALSITGIERFASFIGNLMKLDPTVADKANFDQMADEFADAIGLPPGCTNTDEQVEEKRKMRAQAQQQAAADAQLAQQAQTAQTLAETPTDGKTVLNTVLGGMNAPVPG